MTVSLVIGQGISGSVLAWTLNWDGRRVHIVDRGSENTASRVAAGLLTPFTGRRLSKSEGFDESLKVAKQFYRRLEQETGESLFMEEPATRYFVDDTEKEIFLSQRYEAHRDEIELIQDQNETVTGFRMLKAARLRVKEFLDVTRQRFSATGSFHQIELDPVGDIKVTETGVQVHRIGLTANEVFFCQGYETQENSWFPGIPNAPARGEILRLEIPNRSTNEVVHRGYWLVPVTDRAVTEATNEYLLGATYDRENLSHEATEVGKQELLNGLKLISNESFQVRDHYSAIRASMKNRQPFAARHSVYPQLAILNGMGSKASLMAPITALRLLNGHELSSSGRRLIAQERGEKAISLTKLAHSIVRRAIRPGDTAIDATAGNGHDTVFLASCTEVKGRVLAVDVQAEAIHATRLRLQAEGIRHVELLEEDHSQVLNSLLATSEQVGAIMFNLGYLPGGDKQRTTMPETTIMALEAGIKLLKKGGVMTVIAYRGHSGGQDESRAVEEWGQTNEGQAFSTDIIPGSVENEESPVLYVFRKK